MIRRLAFVLCAAVALAAPGARAQGAAADTSAAPAPPVPPDSPADTSAFGAYMRSLSDSTDVWFGATATPVDTAGLDSALTAGLAQPPGAARRRRDTHTSFDVSPAPGFNRADEAQLGAAATLGLRRLPGRLAGRLQWTTGTHDWLGDAGWRGMFRIGGSGSRLALRAEAGRWSDVLDRDYYDPVITTMSAILFGADRQHYLRRDGFRASARWEHDRVWAAVSWRDQFESSLPFTTDWALFGSQALDSNRSVPHGRARELGVTGEVPVPGTRFRVEFGHWTSAPGLGSGFDYRRSIVTAGGDVSLGRRLALVPQVSYGRLHGEALPQQAFYLGGAPNVRTLERNEWSGAGRAFGRVDLMLADELGSLLRLPLPAWLPLQASTFIASGAAWGRDPVTNQAVPTDRDWPHASEWLSETGLTLAWRTGMPDPLSALRFEYTQPLGPDGRGTAFTVVYQAPVYLLRVR